MSKKLLLILTTIAAAAGGIAALSAFEAHIINVTAHIENALAVSPEEIKFGAVFPQEFLLKPFQIALSQSFKDAERVDDVEYAIKQKPKCIDGEGRHFPIDPATKKCPSDTTEMPSLCPFLSKTNNDPDGTDPENDVSHPSYFVKGTGGAADNCISGPLPEAEGRLTKKAGDVADDWNVDLKVPPFRGYAGQDWPEGCPVIDGSPQGTDFGCDLWIEVTKISAAEPEQEPSPLVINEVYYDAPGADGPNVFIELFGPANQSLDGFKIVGMNGATGLDYLTIDLSGHSIGPVWIFCNRNPGLTAPPFG